MTYAILWISHVGFGLLLVAAVTALASRCKRVLWRKFWPFLTAIPVTILLFFVLVYADALRTMAGWFNLSEIIVCIIAVIIILILGLKGSSGDEQKAKTWPRAWLVALAGASFFVFTMALNIADTRILVSLANIRSDATSKLIGLLPTKLPSSLNAHTLYKDAANAMGPDKELPYSFIRNCESPAFDLASPTVKTFLSNHNGVLDSVRRASSMPGYSLELGMSFIDPLFPETSRYLLLGRLLSLNARSIANEGDILSAFYEFKYLQRMAVHFRGFPRLFSFHDALQIEHIRYSALEYILAQKPHSPGDLINTAVTAQPSVLEDFLTCLRTEAQCLMRSMAVEFSFFGYDPMFLKAESSSNLFSVEVIFGRPFHRVLLAPRVIRGHAIIADYWMNKEVSSYEEFDVNMNASDDAQQSVPMGSYISYYTIYQHDTSRVMECDVHRGLCDLAMAVTAYRARNNLYPARLEELVPEYIDRIPIDPFDGKALKMKSVDGGIDLYSVGSEKKENKQSKVEPIHFYLGNEAYEKFRVKPALEEKRKQAQKKNEQKGGKK